MTYPGTKFEVAMSNILRGDTFKKKRDRRTDLQTDDRRTSVLNKEKSGYNKKVRKFYTIILDLLTCFSNMASKTQCICSWKEKELKIYNYKLWHQSTKNIK